MRLINVETLELQFFSDDFEAPPYVILSHCWGEEEVTLQDVLTKPRHELAWKAGWGKIVSFCERIRQDTVLTCGTQCSWAWVDTCCIDKTSSAELSEAINSMFRWYQRALCCFAWLPDVEGSLEQGVLVPSADFETSRWFTRGWTLQELLAPYYVYFFDKSWRLIGNKRELAHRIQKITNIDLDALTSCNWGHCNVAQKMSWAADRNTTRREDMAYCLMGLFDVNMPLLYGECEKAFIRLQEEIMKETDDQSILAWNVTDGSEELDGAEATFSVGALATHPSQFRQGSMVETLPAFATMAPTARGLQITMPVISQQLPTKGSEKPEEVLLGVLSCRFLNDLNSRVGVPLIPDDGLAAQAIQFVRDKKALYRIPLRETPQHHMKSIYLAKRDKRHTQLRKKPWRCLLQHRDVGPSFNMVCAEPEGCWTKSPTGSCTMLLPNQEEESPVITTVAFLDPRFAGKAFYVVMRLFEDGKGEVTADITSSDHDSDENVRFTAQALTNHWIGGAGSQEALPESLKLDSLGGKILRASCGVNEDHIFSVAISKTRLFHVE